MKNFILIGLISIGIIFIMLLSKSIPQQKKEGIYEVRDHSQLPFIIKVYRTDSIELLDGYIYFVDSDSGLGVTIDEPNYRIYFE